MLKLFLRSTPVAVLGLLLIACGDAKEKAEVTKAANAPIDVQGRRAFAACATCHSAIDPEEREPPRLVGPNLWGVVGRPAASTSFDYSQAMRASGVVWDEPSLDAYIENPSAFVRGNRMAFAGVTDQEERTAIIAYLKTLQ